MNLILSEQSSDVIGVSSSVYDSESTAEHDDAPAQPPQTTWNTGVSLFGASAPKQAVGTIYTYSIWIEGEIFHVFVVISVRCWF